MNEEKRDRLPKSEETIKKLEEIHGHFRALAGIAQTKQGRAGHLESAGVIADALTLLKAQEPRVMTLAEALAADYVYLEIRLHASLPCDCCILAVDPDGGILPLHKGFCAYVDGEEYGETWRCWTSCPTDEQRRAAPWE